MSRRKTSRRWIEPQDFSDARRQASLTRMEAAKLLDVTPRTIQNWETGGARIPWMAIRMLRILRGYALPGVSWEGRTVRGNKIYSPNGFDFDAPSLEYLESVFSMARLWKQMYSRSGLAKTASTVIEFPDRRQQPIEKQRPPEAQPQRMGRYA